MKKFAIILAAGKGSRFNSQLPKQFIHLNDLPIVVHSLRSFARAIPKAKLILVLPKKWMLHWYNLQRKYCPELEIKLVEGGKSRYESVKNALVTIKGNGLVAVHDGARPLVGEDLIRKVYRSAAKHGSAVPVLPVTDSLLRKSKGKLSLVNREEYFLVQTPQCFELKKLKRAYEVKDDCSYTDDSGLWLKSNKGVKVVKGEKNNVKLTFAQDLDSILNHLSKSNG